MVQHLEGYRLLAAEKKLRRSDRIPNEWLIPTKINRHATNLLEVPVTCGILSIIECEITSRYDATALLEKLKQECFSAEQVTVAFCKRAAIAQQLVRHPHQPLHIKITHP